MHHLSVGASDLPLNRAAQDSGANTGRLTFSSPASTLPGMDTIKILLGATVALLLGALAMSWKNFRHEERNVPTEELRKIETQIAEIRLEQERLRLERMRILHGEPATPAPAEEVITDPADIPDTGGVYESPPEAVTPPPAMADDAAGPAEEAPVAPAAEVDRAELIKAAPAVAKVGEWVEDGGFAVVQVLDSSVVKPGAVLCVRRHSGILGRLKIGEVTPEGAIANAIAQFPGPKPQPGDELIVEPK